MLTWPPGRKPISLVGWIVLVSACRHSPAHAPGDAAPAPVVLARPADAAAAADPWANVHVTVEPEPEPVSYARRCALGGPPLATDCSGGTAGIAVTAAGDLYVATGDAVQAYHRVAGEGCRYDPAGAPVKLPPEVTRSQSMDHAVYFRSGGPAWHLAAAPGAVYAVDFLGGLYRVDRGRAEPACCGVYGYESVAAAGGRLIVRRDGLEQLALGPHCTARSAGVDDHTFGDVYAARGKLYVADPSFGELVRYDGTKRVALAEDEHLCSIAGVAACGDGTCIADGNCMKVVELDARGRVQRELDARQLFETRPYSLHGLAAVPGGSVLVLARHRDGSGDRQVCEAAVYELPAALFAVR